mmetsp:Transcript_51972/g.130501  ORF Transcript_51972/g.130501 Transcript_51972/m.130501 type:complete len:151 (-) Transcript_51972:157-609(-)
MRTSLLCGLRVWSRCYRAPPPLCPASMSANSATTCSSVHLNRSAAWLRPEFSLDVRRGFTSSHRHQRSSVPPSSTVSPNSAVSAVDVGKDLDEMFERALQQLGELAAEAADSSAPVVVDTTRVIGDAKEEQEQEQEEQEQEEEEDLKAEL